MKYWLNSSLFSFNPRLPILYIKQNFYVKHTKNFIKGFMRKEITSLMALNNK